MKYIKQLDAVRAIAVLLVIVGHWIPREHFINRVPNAELGVDIFFVLSGFLITWILFENKNVVEQGQASRASFFKNFYIRRTLRIFPIYYLTICFLLLMSRYTGTMISASWPYFFTYTSNFYFFEIGRFDGITSHLWSLSVEEQFYIFWPALVLFVNRRYLGLLCMSLIATGVCTQFFLRSIGMSNYLTPACFDSFGMGSLLAWIWVYHREKLQVIYRYLRWMALFSLMLFVYAAIQTKWHIFPMIRTINSTLAVFVLAGILLRQQKPQSTGWSMLNNKVLIFIGKISYGIYLYHLILPRFTSLLYAHFFGKGMLEDFGLPLYFLVNFIIVILFAWASWIIVERPVLKLKRFFEYKSSQVPLRSVAHSRQV